MMLQLSAWRAVLGEASVEPLAQAYGDNAWVVSAADGSEYILKRFHTIAVGEPLLRLASEHRVLTHLHRYGVPVAVPLVTDDARLYASDGSDVYVLSPRLPGEQGDPESRPDAAAVYARIGAAFGLLHKALAEYPHAVPSYVVVAAEGLTPESLAPIREFDESLADKVDRLRDDLIARLDSLPRQLLHGDPHDGNLLLHDGAVTGFIDVDHLPVGPRIGDLARYLANRMLGAMDAPDEQLPHFRTLVAALLDGYAGANPLTAAERAAIYPAILLRALSNAAWRLEHDDRTSSYVVGSVRTAHWLAGNLAELTDR
jgi:Ser/Thr protein kinase RdoA (MazF antagonist)